MRISDWSSDVCSSDLFAWNGRPAPHDRQGCSCLFSDPGFWKAGRDQKSPLRRCFKPLDPPKLWRSPAVPTSKVVGVVGATTGTRSEEHTSELQSLLRISYAVFSLKKKTHHLITLLYDILFLST